MIEIIDSSFVTSAPNIRLTPENEYQNEVAFMARSNTGKSSLLNTLTQRKSLAKVSATPGKTRLINYFDVIFADRETNERLSAKFVDLPGFGYAKVAKSLKTDWESNLTNFISERKQIRVYVHLIDCRHPDLEIDRSVDQYLHEICTPEQFIVTIFTKIDKLNQKELNELRNRFPGALMVSNSKRRGVDKIVEHIYRLLKSDDE
ncbi:MULTISPECIES: ribosome biogenesis GTP-binding protein YihA/YsxC [unclassified Sulfuricurvum]|uniref:ribosome biogenesis GTP-binding protein YihA/YsxC n=1 Tax=unclassified Sulfuricurvum TaxID=2632390 RepID=UPI0002999DE9|nr:MULTISPECIES: ribosome biogenesis GTP-binding protein YihA/YsxC [unclassified Sulfuricurvum]OHD81885.1 MAG: YihA family ribosome biogenesis GTP-binding protein [Sulfuricurvum sp. RIFCSPHIGHO2_02_FULL_43_9]OHD83283.1 MAG: YihA family ribosome biogenesis GTP-binding protein [Sulfuricurvum sp. RIFCSPHIGHO2_12_FULL_44_8]OHD83895.1 MAG: YihA family ribosome biogenesis GTP-binding protein [Sulfuricurvum sp. RIFCSPLOWO2_02_43_6]OHD86539.1 MAG: YihA family ribosome biogenesis GTP-binding protein [Su